MSDDLSNQTTDVASATDDRLESWKAIASHLSRSVRTVRRWEEREGLPVYRHKHDRGNTVFAYKSEIDEWRQCNVLESMPAPISKVPASLPVRPPVRRWKVAHTFLGLGALALGFFLVALIFFRLDSLPAERVVEATHGDRLPVLVTDVNNSTGLSVFGSNLASQLARELYGSGLVDILSKERMRTLLGLMRLPVTTAIDADLGREIGLRVGGIQVVIAPRAERLGDTYLISVDLIDPTHGSLIASVSEAVPHIDGLLPSLQSLSDGLQLKLANELPRLLPASPALEQVTTASLRALKLYTRADELLKRGHPAPADRLLRQAVNVDPEFAAGYIHLAWAEYRLGNDRDQYLPMAEKALTLTATVADQERHYIAGSYHQLRGNPKTAEAYYGALLSLSAGHYWGSRHALELCALTNFHGHCVSQALELAKQHPEDLHANNQAARALAVWAKDPDSAQIYSDRAQRLLTIHPSGQFDPVSVVQTKLFPMHSAWSSADISRLLQEERRIAETYDDCPPDLRDALARELGIASLSVGRLQQARHWFSRITDSVIRHEMFSRLLFLRGDSDALRDHLAAGVDYNEPFTTILLSSVGLEEQATKLLNRLELRGIHSPRLQVVHAKRALQQGRLPEALTLLRKALADTSIREHCLFFVGTDMLAMALKEKQGVSAAIRTLESTIHHKSQSAFSNSGMFWVMCQYNLASLYLEAGRTQDAIRIRTELLKVLANADLDFPMLEKVQGLSPVGA